jgi:Protein of unknown function (DUF3035)
MTHRSSVNRSRVSAGIALLALALLLPALAACSGLSDALGLNKKSPDEFTVVKRAPLVLPPNYNLRPPAPGTPRPQELEPTRAAQAAVLATAGSTPSKADDGDHSAGESALIHLAGAENADPNIRREIERETTALVEADQSFTDRLLFWREKPPAGEIVDAKAEASRIRENQATGKSVVEGATPIIRHRKRGLLEGIF